jgi:hypothetical protein
MSRLEELTPGARVRGILPDALITVVNVQWFGDNALEHVYRDGGGKVATQLLYRDDEPPIEIAEQGRPWGYRERVPDPPPPPPPPDDDGVDRQPRPPEPRPPKAPTRYHGSVRLDATRAGRDAGRIADEVLAHLVGLVGADVTVTLEIEATIPGGAPEHVVRTVTQNGRDLKFTSGGFETE